MCSYFIHLWPIARNDLFFKAISWGVIPTAVPFSFVFIYAQIIYLKNWHIIPSNYPSKNFNKSNKFARKPKGTTFLFLSLPNCISQLVTKRDLQMCGPSISKVIEVQYRSFHFFTKWRF